MAARVSDHLLTLAQTAPLSPAHWSRFFAGLRQEIPVDRICALLQADRYTGIVVRVAQEPELEAALGGEGFYADREHSKAFAVIAEGQPALVRPEEWTRYPDLQFFWPTLRSNLKFPVSLGGWAAVWNVWSRKPEQYTEADLERLRPLAAEVSRSPFRFEAPPVGLAIRQMLALQRERQAQGRAVA